MQSPETLRIRLRHRWASDKASHRHSNHHKQLPEVRHRWASDKASHRHPNHHEQLPEVRHRWASDKASHRHSNHQKQLLKTLERIAFHWMTGDKDSHPVLSERTIKIQLHSL